MLPLHHDPTRSQEDSNLQPSVQETAALPLRHESNFAVIRPCLSETV